jgi:hypothetical protein
MQWVLLYYEYSCINSVYRNYIIPFDQIRYVTYCISHVSLKARLLSFEPPQWDIQQDCSSQSVWLIHKIARTVPTTKTNNAANPYGSFDGLSHAETSYAYPRRQMMCSRNMIARNGVSQYAMQFKKFSITVARWSRPATAAARNIAPPTRDHTNRGTVSSPSPMAWTLRPRE